MGGGIFSLHITFLLRMSVDIGSNVKVSDEPRVPASVGSRFIYCMILDSLESVDA